MPAPYKITALSPSGPVTLARGIESRRVADMQIRILATDFYDEYFAFCIEHDESEDKSMAENYRPKFHNENTITYWHEIHGWIHRVHPLKISTNTIENWESKDVHRRVLMLRAMGYIRVAGKWELKK